MIKIKKKYLCNDSINEILRKIACLKMSPNDCEELMKVINAISSAYNVVNSSLSLQINAWGGTPIHNGELKYSFDDDQAKADFETHYNSFLEEEETITSVSKINIAVNGVSNEDKTAIADYVTIIEG
jgi:hypothetical protein